MIRMLYDATILSNYNCKDGGRSGIFFVAYQLLKELSKRKELELSLYCSPESYDNLVPFIKSEFPNLDFVCCGHREGLRKLFNLYDSLQRWNPRNVLIHKFRTVLVIAGKEIMSIIPACYSKAANAKNEKYLHKLQIYLSPMMKVPDFIATKMNIKKVVIVHDMIPYIFNEYAQAKRTGWFAELVESINKNDFYFAISESTKIDFLRYCKKANSSHVFVINDGVSDCLKPNRNTITFKQVREKYGNFPPKYIFSLCSQEMRKNLVMQMKAFFAFIKKDNIHDLYYVIAGGKTGYELINKQLNDAMRELGEYVKYIGYVDDDDLPILYSNAQWFTFTSKYEGFGMPPVEAMKCGCPVVASNNSSFPEICGNAAILIDCDSENEHLAAYERYYYDEKLRKENSEKGISQAAKFNWKFIVDEMIKKFIRIINYE